MFERIAGRDEEGGKSKHPRTVSSFFLLPYLSFPIYRFQKINLIRVRTPRARKISFTFHRCGLSTISRRPSSLPPSLWRASHTGGRRVEFVSRRLFPVDLLALANLSKGERREGIRVVRGYELVESKSYGLLSPWIRPISTRSTFPPIDDFFFLSVLLLFSSSFRRVLRATFEFTSVLPRCLVTERVGGSYPPHRRRVGSLLSKRRPG